MKKTLLNFVSFLKNPKDELSSDQTFSFKIRTFSTLFVLDVLLMMMLLGLISIFENNGTLDSSEHEINSIMETFPIIAIIGLVVILHPFLEELIFRLFLKYKRNIPFLILEGFTSKEEARGYWDRGYKTFFYASALVFGLIHISNYSNPSTAILLLTPLLIAPQVIMGLICGYLRVKFSFMWGFYFHAFHNLIFIGAALLAMNQAFEKENISNDDYDFKLSEIALSNQSDFYNTLNEDTLELKNYTAKNLYAYLMENEKDNIIIKHKSIKGIKFNLELLAKKDSLNLKEIALKEFNTIYDVEISKENKNTPSWYLNIIDTQLLMKSNVIDSTLVNFGSDFSYKKAKMKSHKIKQLSIWLNSYLKEDISSEITMQEQFDFILPSTRDINIMKDSLEQNYGLTFSSKDNITEQYIIKEIKKDTE